MDKRTRLLSTLSILALGISVTPNGATAATTYSTANIQQCTATSDLSEVECACNLALEDGSPEALANFLERFAANAGDTACAAIASTALTINERGNEPVGGKPY